MNRAQKHSFLVVDDEPYVLDSIYDLFRRDYQVFRAGTAAEARKVLAQEQIQIVMSDQRMPDVTGVELLREIKNDYPDTIRLIFTGYADLEVVVRAINEGEVFRYVTKPWDSDELRGILKQAADYYDLLRERLRLIADLRQANAELRTANALKAAFLDIASHELNTPVTIILGMSELAREQAEQPGGEPLRSHIKVIHSGARRLERLVENMLKLLQARSFQTEIVPSEVRCKTLFDAVHAQVAPFLARRKQRLDIQVDPENGTLQMDQGKFHDVILNLVMNAIKFSPDGSTVLLSAKMPPDAPSIIEVRDFGSGISQQDLPHIFEPFFSTFDTLHHSSGSFEYGKRGLGMGLAIVKKFVEMHRGTVRAEPDPTRGTRFIIQLPGANPAAEQPGD